MGVKSQEEPLGRWYRGVGPTGGFYRSSPHRMGQEDFNGRVDDGVTAVNPRDVYGVQMKDVSMTRRPETA